MTTTLIEKIKNRTLTNIDELNRLIQTIDVGFVDIAKRTALIWACEQNMEDVALELIKTGKSKPEQIDIIGQTALIIACENRMNNVALTLIRISNYPVSQVDYSNSDTALIMACENEMEDIALELIKTNRSNSEQVNKQGNTALIIACRNEMENIALQLINKVYSNLEQIDKNGNTALMWCCELQMETIALELIKTGLSNEAQINKEGDTALIIACKNNMENVALSLLNSGKTNPKHLNNIGLDSLYYAKQNNMTNIINIIQGNKELCKFNINSTFVDIIDGIESSVENYLKQGDNVVFVFLTSDTSPPMISGLPIDMLNNALYKELKFYTVYECKQPETMRPENIIIDKPYFDLKKLFGISDLASMQSIYEIRQIIESGVSSNIFIFKKTDKRFVSTVSDDYLKGRVDALGARHCQTNQDATIYEMQRNIVFTCSNDNAKGGKKKFTKRYKKRNNKTKKGKRKNRRNKSNYKK